jgi:hypothetical protein
MCAAASPIMVAHAASADARGSRTPTVAHCRPGPPVRYAGSMPAPRPAKSASQTATATTSAAGQQARTQFGGDAPTDLPVRAAIVRRQLDAPARRGRRDQRPRASP